MTSLDIRLQRSAETDWPGLRVVGWSSGGSMTAPVRDSRAHLVRHDADGSIDSRHSAICGRRLPRLSRWDFPSDVEDRHLCAACVRVLRARGPVSDA